MLKSLKKTLYKKMHISLMRMIINTIRRKIFDTNVEKKKEDCYDNNIILQRNHRSVEILS